MPSLEERDLCVVHTCNHCKYCAIPWAPRISENLLITIDFRYLCMLDSSEEDRKYVERELSKLMHENTFTVNSDRLRQLLRLNESKPDFRDSPRCVTELLRCQFYEVKEHWKDKEGTVQTLPVFTIPKDGLIPEKEDKEEKDA